MPWFPGIVNDLNEIWRDLKGQLSYSFSMLVNPIQAPPSNRSPDVGFITLYNADDNLVGCFIPELYELAKIQGLRFQLEEIAWRQHHPDPNDPTLVHQPFYSKLYRADGSRKTAFELATLPVNYNDRQKKSARPLQKHIEDEFNYRIERRLPLPAISYKYQIESDYLKNIAQIGLHAGNSRSIKLNLLNPEAQMTNLEIGLHYIGQRIAFIMTMVAAFSIVGAYSPIMLSVFVMASILAKWCSNEFSTYGLAESLLRDLGWLRTPQLRAGEKISLKKSLKTGFLLGAILLAAGEAVFLAWSEIMVLAWPTASTFLLSSALASSQFLLAGMLAATAGLMVATGAIVAVSFFWGLGIWDKHIDFSQERAESFPPLQPESFTTKIQGWERKFRQALTNQEAAPTPIDPALQAQTQQAFAQLRQLYTQMQQRPREAQPLGEYEQRNGLSSPIRIVN